MRTSKLFLVAVAAVLAGCSDGTNNVDTGPEPVTPVSFSSVVRDMFSATADDTDPVEVDEAPLEFNDLDNPAAFDDLLQ